MPFPLNSDLEVSVPVVNGIAAFGESGQPIDRPKTEPSGSDSAAVVRGPRTSVPSHRVHP